MVEIDRAHIGLIQEIGMRWLAFGRCSAQRRKGCGCGRMGCFFDDFGPPVFCTSLSLFLFSLFFFGTKSHRITFNEGLPVSCYFPPREAGSSHIAKEMLFGGQKKSKDRAD